MHAQQTITPVLMFVVVCGKTEEAVTFPSTLPQITSAFCCYGSASSVR